MMRLSGVKLLEGTIPVADLAADGGVWSEVSPGGGSQGRELLWSAGAIDAHINGWGGCDFLRDDPADHSGALRNLCRSGVTGFLPTLITCGEPDLRAALARWSAWSQMPGNDAPAFLGIHLEGPFLNPDCAGAHPRHHLRLPDRKWIATLVDDFPGLIRLVTLAPELDGAMAVVDELSGRGITVGLGHSRAEAAVVEQAVERGARYVTHLFNAMGPFHHRRPGLSGVALAGEELFCEVIADGHHLGSESLAIAWRCLGPRRLLLVSDAVSGAGTEGGRFRLGEVEGFVKEGRAVDSRGRLCGGVVSPWAGLVRLAESAGVSWREVVPCIREAVIRALGLPLRTGPAPGETADLVGVDAGGRVRAVVRGGRWLRRHDHVHRGGQS